MKLKFVSDGERFQVVDELGEALEDVESVSFTATRGEEAVLTVTVAHPPLAYDAPTLPNQPDKEDKEASTPRMML